MAKLTSGNFTVEIQVVAVSASTAEYHVQLRYGGNNIFNSMTTDKGFIVNEIETNGYLMQALKVVLSIKAEETHGADDPCVIWEPDRNTFVRITPVFIKDVYDSRQEHLHIREMISYFKGEGGHFPEDVFMFTFKFLVEHQESLGGQFDDWGNSVGISILVKRSQLEEFRVEFKKELHILFRKSTPAHRR